VRTAVCIALLCAACSFSETEPSYHTGLEGLDIVSVDPPLLLPGTTLVVEGRSFIGDPWGDSELRLAGTFTDGDRTWDVDARVPATFVDFEHVELSVGEGLFAELGARTGDLVGTATIAVESSVDHEVHLTPALPVSLTFRTEIRPRLDTVDPATLIYVNDQLLVEGADMLLGGDEGTTIARVEGCFALAGAGDCVPVGPVDVPVAPASRFDRTRGAFPFVPEIAGIRAGGFEGQVELRNQFGRGGTLTSDALAAAYELTESEVELVTPDAVSLGQYMEVQGGGFVGGALDQVTLLHLVGEYQPERGDTTPVPIDTVLVPEFVSGRAVRYVMNEDDDLGSILDLRGGTGSLTGTVTPIVSFGDDEVTGPARALSVRIAPIKQVVYIDFTTQYVTSLQHFGLRAVEPQIRQRILDVVARDYGTLNVELRDVPPTDFSLFSQVDVGGPDPNGLGLLGYDNTPGKDVGNLRLHDRIGGVNATTQADGFPGFGGVFVDSMFTFSEHPGGFAVESPGVDPLFDDLFDPFRPDEDGEPVEDTEANDIAVLDGGASCPADDRQGRIECAVWVLGSLIGTTISHELGHSLGLANPGGSEVHLLTDKPNRLMEAGGGRSFRERAEMGEGPGVFCDEEYVYLRTIVAAEVPPDDSSRPDCL
jgi:hypothetical protein